MEGSYLEVIKDYVASKLPDYYCREAAVPGMAAVTAYTITNNSTFVETAEKSISGLPYYVINNTTTLQLTDPSINSHFFAPLVALIGLGAVAFLIIRKH